jgi:nucleoid-associated protein YgaU
MSARDRLVAATQLAAVVALSILALAGLHRAAGRTYFQIDWSDLRGWLAVTPPEDALMAGVRVLALAVAWWVLGSTLVYLGVRAGGLPATLRMVEWAALPAVRRLADRAVAVTLAGSTALGAAAPALAANPEPPAVMPTAVVVHVDGPGVEDAGYVATPADEDPFPVGDLLPVGPPPFRLPIPDAPAPVAAGPPPASQSVENGGRAAGSEDAAPPDANDDGLEAPPLLPRVEAAAAPASGHAVPDTGVRTPTGATGEERETAGREQAASPRSHTVVAGDHLWDIAERTLAAAWERPPSPEELASYWRQLVAASIGRLASGDPDLIFPGEVIDLPAIPDGEEVIDHGAPR